MVGRLAPLLIAQFDICPVRHGAGGTTTRFAVVLQHDFLREIATKLVAPLMKDGQVRRVSRLHPVVAVADEQYVLAVERAAAIPTRQLGAPIGSAQAHRDEIMAVLDLLFTGF